ncbi:MAG: hypothetical protein ACXVQV_06255, partial [Actinomycetota bacterium]
MSHIDRKCERLVQVRVPPMVIAVGIRVADARTSAMAAESNDETSTDGTDSIKGRTTRVTSAPCTMRAP